MQFFLGDPQGYKGPEVRYAGGAAGAARRPPRTAGVDLYVHAPYIVNVATTNNRIRIPSRKLLQQHVDAAAEIGAKGLIVHGGHVNKTDDPAGRLRQLAQGVEATDLKIPLLIENTAGGDNAMARHLDRIAGVWDAISAAERRRAWSASASTPATPGPAASTLGDAVDRTSAPSPAGSTWSTPTTRRDAFDSGADRHANFGQGTSAGRRVRGRGARGRRPGHLRDPGRRPPSTSPTSPGCASGSEPTGQARGVGRRRRRCCGRPSPSQSSQVISTSRWGPAGRKIARARRAELARGDSTRTDVTS